MGSRRVLIIDDNVDTARTLAAFLKSEGHAVEYAINGYAALTLAKQFLPEVVILDLGLPGLDGFEVCNRLKREPDVQNARIIVVSGYAGNEDRLRSKTAGCDAHLAKPADPQELLTLIAA
jgi:CheY-like chemotaxis protein